MKKSYKDFKKKVIGKGFDVDGHYGNQCWDGYAEYCLYLGYPYANCTTSGYAKDVWNNRKTNGTLKNFMATQKPHVGAVVVFDNAKLTPDSHIGIVDSFDEAKGTLYVLGQNQGGLNGAFNVVNFGFDGVLGYLMPKQFITKKPLKKSVDAIALEVIQGKWGNGFKRRVALKKAGYDYKVIQKRVDELLSK